MKRMFYLVAMTMICAGGLFYLQGCGKGNAPVIISIKGATQ